MNSPLKCQLYFGFLLLILFANQSCKKDDTGPSYNIPTAYNFENVNYDGQSQRLSQMLELKSYMATPRSTGQPLSAERLHAMFTNDMETAQWQGTYDASKQLRDKTYDLERLVFDALLVELAEVSQSTGPGSQGVPGLISSLDGSKKYLIGGDGLDHAQLIEKGLMGACFYYQATSVYMGEGKMNVDNETIEPGKGTAMEHHWDEAFGYLGVPTDFPVNLDGLSFWGSYSNQRNGVLGSNQTIMDALLKGRAAITNNDLFSREEAITEARRIWELIAVGSALHYLNVGIEHFEDPAVAFHGLSEGIGFIYSLQFNPSAKINQSQIGDLLTLIAGSDDFSAMNLYETTVSNLQSAKDQLADYYGIGNLKNDF